jgi:hypothetical protein
VLDPVVTHYRDRIRGRRLRRPGIATVATVGGLEGVERL